MSSFLTVCLPPGDPPADLVKVLAQLKLNFHISAKIADHTGFMTNQQKTARTIPKSTTARGSVISIRQGEELKMDSTIPPGRLPPQSAVPSRWLGRKYAVLPKTSLPASHKSSGGPTFRVVTPGQAKGTENGINQAGTSLGSPGIPSSLVTTSHQIGKKGYSVRPGFSEAEGVVKQEEEESSILQNALPPAANPFLQDSTGQCTVTTSSLKDCDEMTGGKRTENERDEGALDCSQERPIHATDIFRRDEEEMEIKVEPEISEKPPVIDDEANDMDFREDWDDEEEGSGSEFDDEPSDLDEAEALGAVWTDSPGTSFRSTRLVAICRVCKLPESSPNHAMGMCGQSTYFECEFCYRKYSSSQALLSHRVIHIGPKITKKRKAGTIGGEIGEPFKCPYCPALFKTRKSKLLHAQRTHEYPDRFKCSDCDKAFGRLDALEKHERTHTKETPFECTICDRKFSYDSSYRYHMLVHSGEKPYKCDVCGDRFRQRSTLNTHKKRHTGDRPFECKECHRTFRRAHTLKNHMGIHTGERAFQCKECPKNFLTSWNLREHCVRCHSEKKSDE